jgi:hypothetical protein
MFLAAISAAGVTFDSLMAPLFLKHAPLFRAATVYISGFTQMNAMITARTSSPGVQRALTALATKNPAATPEKVRSLGSYLITPVQRLPRYLLFLRELKKFTPPFHPDAFLLDAAHAETELVTRRADAEADRVLGLQKISELHARLRNPKEFTLLTSTRFYKTEFQVTLQKPTATTGPGIIYVFSDAVFISSTDGRSETGLLLKLINDFPYFGAYDTLEASFWVSQSGKKVLGHSRNHYVLKFADAKTYRECAEIIESARATRRSGVKGNVVWQNIYLSTPLDRVANAAGWGNGPWVYFGGGERSGDHPVATVTAVNITTQEVDITTAPWPARSGHTITNIGDSAYLYGGRAGSTFFADVWRWQAGNWTQVPVQGTPPPGRAFHTACVWRGKLVIFGGLTGKRPTNALISFDPNTRTWSTVNDANLPEPRYRHSATISKQSMIVHGGQGASRLLSDSFAYDFLPKQWRALDVMLPPRAGHQAPSTGRGILLLGGATDSVSGAPPTLIDANFAAEQYALVGNAPLSLMDFAYISVGIDKLIVYGGCEAGTKTPRASVFSVEVAIAETTEAAPQTTRARSLSVSSRSGHSLTSITTVQKTNQAGLRAETPDRVVSATASLPEASWSREGAEKPPATASAPPPATDTSRPVAAAKVEPPLQEPLPTVEPPAQTAPVALQRKPSMGLVRLNSRSSISGSLTVVARPPPPAADGKTDRLTEEELEFAKTHNIDLSGISLFKQRIAIRRARQAEGKM